MLKLIVVGSTKVSDQRSVQTGDYDGTFSSGDRFFNAIFRTDAGFGTACVDKLFGIGIFANTTDINNGFWRENVLFQLHHISKRGVPI